MTASWIEALPVEGKYPTRSGMAIVRWDEAVCALSSTTKYQMCDKTACGRHALVVHHYPEISIDEMNPIDFDWFTPTHCHRQTPTELLQRRRECSQDVTHFKPEEAGITVAARRPQRAG